MQSSLVAVSWHDPKAAALYFDRVFPLTDFHHVPSRFLVELSEIESTYVQLATEYESASGKTDFEMLVENIHQPPTFWDYDTAWIANDYVSAVSVALSRAGYDAVPIYHGDDEFETYLRLLDNDYYDDRVSPQEEESAAEVVDAISTERGCVEVELTELPIVDTTELAWERIIDFRDDSEASSLLRSLRLLIDADLRGRSPDYIRAYVADKLTRLTRLSDHHRLDLRSATVRALLDSRALLASSVVAAAGALGGQPVVAGASIAAGIMGEALEVGLRIGEVRRKHTTEFATAELAYLHRVRSNFV